MVEVCGEEGGGGRSVERRQEVGGGRRSWRNGLSEDLWSSGAQTGCCMVQALQESTQASLQGFC